MTLLKNTLQHLFSEYENEMRFSMRLRPTTIRGYRAVFNLFTKIMPEITTLEQLSGSVMLLFFKNINNRERLVGRKYKRGVKPSTIKTQWNKLNAFFKWLVQKGYISEKENPLYGMKSPSVRYDDFKTLSNEQIQRMYGAINMYSSNPFLKRRDTLIISIPLYCGLRRGELLNLRVMDIDMEKNLLTVRGETSKSKKTRVLPIPPMLQMHLKDYFTARNDRNLKTSYLIVSNRCDRGLSYEGIKHWVNAVEKKSGVEFHVHMLRHNYATRLDEENISAFKIQKLMGHASISTTQRYVRSSTTESMAEDVAKISYGSHDRI